MLEKFKPMFDRIVVDPFDMPNMTSGGVLLPENADRQQAGEVMAVGDGDWEGGHFRPTTVKVGDIILFAKNYGAEVRIDGQTFTLIQEKSVMGILLASREEAQAPVILRTSEGSPQELPKVTSLEDLPSWDPVAPIPPTPQRS